MIIFLVEILDDGEFLEKVVGVGEVFLNFSRYLG